MDEFPWPCRSGSQSSRNRRPESGGLTPATLRPSTTLFPTLKFWPRCPLPPIIATLFRERAAQFGCNPFSGHGLVFCNWRSDRLKILYWDRDGWAIWYKRLEAGTFEFLFARTGRKELAARELAVLLEGIDLNRGKRRKRYTLPQSTEESEQQLRKEL